MGMCKVQENWGREVMDRSDANAHNMYVAISLLRTVSEWHQDASGRPSVAISLLQRWPMDGIRVPLDGRL